MKNFLIIIEGLEEELQYSKQIIKISLQHLDSVSQFDKQEAQKNQQFFECLDNL